MSWTVDFSKKAAKQARDLPKAIQDHLRALIKDIEAQGPVRGDWPNYSKLSGKDTHHCHLTHRYVACWEVVDHEVRFVEVYYVGTREKAPY